MRPIALSLFLVAAAPVFLFAENKEHMQMQRDIALLQEQVRDLQRSQDQQLAALKTLVQQTLDSVSKVNTTVAVLDGNVRDRMKEQATNLVGPVANLGSRVDSMASEFQALKESIADMNARLGKLQQQLVDMGNTMKVLQSPAPPPPGAGSASIGAGGPPAGVSAESLYADAMRNKDGGSYDLALQQFNDYLKFFGSTDMAPNAQYYVGEIQFRRGDLDSALTAFDMVLEKYPQNNKTADAMYMKGQTLVKMGERTKGAQEYRELISTFPSSELAAKAKAQLKAMGLSAAPAPASKRSRRK